MLGVMVVPLLCTYRPVETVWVLVLQIAELYTRSKNDLKINNCVV